MKRISIISTDKSGVDFRKCEEMDEKCRLVQWLDCLSP